MVGCPLLSRNRECMLYICTLRVSLDRLSECCFWESGGLVMDSWSKGPGFESTLYRAKFIPWERESTHFLTQFMWRTVCSVVSCPLINCKRLTRTAMGEYNIMSFIAKHLLEYRVAAKGRRRVSTHLLTREKNYSQKGCEQRLSGRVLGAKRKHQTVLTPVHL